MINEYKKRMEGSIDRRGGLRWNNFSKIKLAFPSCQEQEAIAKILTTADKEIELLEKELEMIKEQKNGLMELLLTGIVRVK